MIVFGIAGSVRTCQGDDRLEEQFYGAFYRIKVSRRIEFSPDVLERGWVCSFEQCAAVRISGE
jgi:hypothetical protein